MGFPLSGVLLAKLVLEFIESGIFQSNLLQKAEYVRYIDNALHIYQYRTSRSN